MTFTAKQKPQHVMRIFKNLVLSTLLALPLAAASNSAFASGLFSSSAWASENPRESQAQENSGAIDAFLNRPIRVGVQREFVQYNEGVTYKSTRSQLEERLGQGRVIFTELNSAQLGEAVADEKVDFVISEATFFTSFESSHGLKSVASLWPMTAPDPAFSAGTLFIARSGDDSIADVSDFAGKMIGAFYPQSFSGYLIGMRELYRQGLVLDSLKGRIVYYGYNPLKLAQAVHDGSIDVGMMPACWFERLTNEHRIDRSRYRLIGTRKSGLIHCQTSTDLYPSMYFSSLRNTDAGLQKTVSAALFTMAAIADGSDWSLPVSNRSVLDLFFDLKMGPYANLTAWQLSVFAREQTTTVLIFIGICLLIILYAGSLSVLVRRRTKLLNQALEDRQRIEQQATASRDHIANLERTGIVGQMSTMIAHELKQPLGAITNFAHGLLRRSKRGAIDPKVLNEVLEEIVEQGTRASEIVNRVRSYAKRQSPELKLADMSVSVERAIETFKRSRRTEAAIIKNVLPYLWADIDDWEIELAVLNLLKNAADALEDIPGPQIIVRVVPVDRYWRVEVKDNGSKITQEQVDAFMKPLVTSKAGGMGLGLSIVGNIVERHHGHLSAYANPQGGVSMCMDIPRAVIPEHTAM